MTDKHLFSKVESQMSVLLNDPARLGASTGPKTAEGKARSSANSLKHGLTARLVVIAGEDQAEFDRTLANLISEHQPEGTLESEIVGEIAGGLWRLSRPRKYEAETLESSFTLFSNNTRQTPGLDRLLRYTGSIELQLNRAIVRLQQLQADRRKRAGQAAKTDPPLKTMAAGAANSTTSESPEFVSSSASAHSPLITDHYPPTTTHCSPTTAAVTIPSHQASPNLLPFGGAVPPTHSHV